jgi:hypothetical protein
MRQPVRVNQIKLVMAGACPGHPRLASFHGHKDVDARVKPGHDEEL